MLANAGSRYGDAPDLGARLIDLVEGRPVPAPPNPAALIWFDVAVLLLAAATVVPAICGVRRAPGRPGRYRLARLLPGLLPPLLLLTLDRVVSALYRGRDISWTQAAYLSPAVTLLLVVTSAACVTVLGAHLARWARRVAGTSPGRVR